MRNTGASGGSGRWAPEGEPAPRIANRGSGRWARGEPPRRRCAGLALPLLAWCAGASACGASTADPTGLPQAGDALGEAPPAAQDGASPASGDAPSAASDAGEAPPAPGQSMTRAQAQQYVLRLVNQDRAAHKLPPVVWDEPAARAGQRHAEDMARLGFTGHFGSDGSVPEQRYTAASGVGFVMENAGCVSDGIERELDPDPRFTAESLLRVHQAFMNEKPPADGHRRNVLTGSHTSLGVGLAKAKDLDIACMAQEFVDAYGAYEVIPARAKVGDAIRVAGEIRQPATFAGVGLSRTEAGKPLKGTQLRRGSAYAIPAPYATFFPKGFKTPIPVQVAGNKFSIEVPLDDRGRPGLYGVSVWATFPGSAELRMVSLRTVAVDPGTKAGAR